MCKLQTRDRGSGTVTMGRPRRTGSRIVEEPSSRSFLGPKPVAVLQLSLSLRSARKTCVCLPLEAEADGLWGPPSTHPIPLSWCAHASPFPKSPPFTALFTGSPLREAPLEKPDHICPRRLLGPVGDSMLRVETVWFFVCLCFLGEDDGQEVELPGQEKGWP